MNAPQEPSNRPLRWYALRGRFLLIVFTVAAIACSGIELLLAPGGVTRRPRLVGAVIACVCVAVTVWFYWYQDAVKSRRVSLWSLLMLVLAIAVGLQLGLLLIAPAMP